MRNYVTNLRRIKKMKKCFRKVLSLFMVAVLMVSLVPIAQVEVSATSTQWVFPVRGRNISNITCLYDCSPTMACSLCRARGWGAWRNSTHGSRHNGIDVGNANEEVLATRRGTVVENDWCNIAGWFITIDHGEINGVRYWSWYIHLAQKSPVAIGRDVPSGYVIGRVGESGSGAQGAHLHFEVRRGAHNFNSGVDPVPYLRGDNDINLGTTRRDDIGDNFHAILIRHNDEVLANESNATRWFRERRNRSQIMHFQRHPDGSYTITSVSDGKALDVRFGNEQNSEIGFSDPHYHDNQRFWIESSNNHIMLSPKSGHDFVVDAMGHQGNFSSGSQLWTVPRNDTREQWFELRRIDNLNTYITATRADNIGNDFHAILIRHNNEVLTNENNATRWRTERRDVSQIMHFQRHSDGTYRITALSNGRSLDVKFGDEQDSEIYFHEQHSGNNQRFRIESSNNHIMLSPRSATNFVIDAMGHQGNFASGSQLWSVPRNDTREQWFELRRIVDVDEYLNSDCACGDCFECGFIVVQDSLYISSFDSTENGGWLELHNPTTTAISTRGLYLSNDDDDFFLWQMPAVIAREGETVRVRASGNGVCVALKRMTANFDFSNGETLRLVDAHGVILFEISVE
jgi:hypothetical protein